MFVAQQRKEFTQYGPLQKMHLNKYQPVFSFVFKSYILLYFIICSKIKRGRTLPFTLLSTQIHAYFNYYYNCRVSPIKQMSVQQVGVFRGNEIEILFKF